MSSDIDAVYTWVDGAWPGYDALLRTHAQDAHDLNPNRYRDNLSLLKYSLRSLERFAPWIRNVVIVTSRPQTPPWLDTRTVRLVHHDEFMAPETLPTFNSFAIVSQLHRIPDLSRRFVYVEDDRLFGAEVSPADFFHAGGGDPHVFLEPRHTVAPRHATDARLSPWNRALARSNQLLDARYGAGRRRTVLHVPLPVDIYTWADMIEVWPDAFRQTMASRFRATGNVVPEHLYPHYLLEEGWGRLVPRRRSRRSATYHPLNNIWIFQRLGLARVRWRRAKFVCLNDDFGEHPNARVVAMVKRALDSWFPRPSRFERDAHD